MVRLHLIGFTTDLKNLIFATRRGAKRGGYLLEIDRRLLGTLEEIEKLDTGTDLTPDQSPAPKVEPPPQPVHTSVLSPKEIQALLREGKSEEQVAKQAQTDVSWIRRFTAPILAERAGVIEAVQAGLIAKRRLGPSSTPVGEAIRQNLIDKRVAMDPDSFDRSWKAIRKAGLWQVSFQYLSRGKRRLARFSFDPESRSVQPLNAVALEVGWRSSTLKRARREPAGNGLARRSSPSRSAGTNGSGRVRPAGRSQKTRGPGGKAPTGRASHAKTGVGANKASGNSAKSSPSARSRGRSRSGG